MKPRIFLTASPYALEPSLPIDGWAILLRHPIVQTKSLWYRNINLFPIDYAFRPRLRDRLTLSGLTFLRKPWTFGEQGSHLLYRYLCRQGHFRTLHRSFRFGFDAYGTLFDVHSAAAHHEDALGADRERLSAIWRQKQLEYTWLRSLMGRYTDFWNVTEEALDHALAVRRRAWA